MSEHAVAAQKANQAAMDSVALLNRELLERNRDLGSAQKRVASLENQLAECKAKLAEKADEAKGLSTDLAREFLVAMAEDRVVGFAERHGYALWYPSSSSLVTYHIDTAKAVLAAIDAPKEPDTELLREFVEALANGKVSGRSWPNCPEREDFGRDMHVYYRRVAEAILNPHPKGLTQAIASKRDAAASGIAF